jgi:hypothetical protein
VPKKKGGQKTNLLLAIANFQSLFTLQFFLKKIKLLFLKKFRQKKKKKKKKRAVVAV